MQKCLSKKNQKIASCRQLFVCAANIPRLLKITDYFLLVCRNIKLSVRALKFAFLKEKKSSLLHDNVCIREVRDKSASTFQLIKVAKFLGFLPLKLLKNTKSQKVAGLIACIYFQFGSLPLFLLYGVMCFLSNHPPLCQFASCCVDASYGFDFFCC